MDVIRFVGWWWDRRDAPEKTLIIFFFWVLVSLPWMFFYGVGAILVFFGGLALSGAIFLLYHIYQSLKIEWYKFKAEREAEAQNIVNRLSGKPKTTAEEILEKLRASHDRFKSI